MDVWSRLFIHNFNGTDSWKQTCVSELDNAVNNGHADNIFAGLVNRAGNYVDIRDNNTEVFSFKIFSAGATNYLLPWLALTAQLPFETGEHNVIANFMSFCMALGSPMFITYSLMVTILNQHWLRGHFRDLETQGHMRETVKNARIFLQESQQVPLRLSQEDGSLGSLIVLAENKAWWQRLSDSVLRTRRSVTLSLVAQMLVAILSWVLTVAAAFLSSLGNPTEALVLSSGSLWVWLIPVIAGWISVGTQNDHSTIGLALYRDEACIARPASSSGLTGRRARNSSAGASVQTVRVDPQDPYAMGVGSPLSEKGVVEEIETRAISVASVKKDEQKGFRIANHRTSMRPLLRTTVSDGRVRLEDKEPPVPRCFGFSVAGDEKQEGPAFNYARIFTWWHVANQVHGMFQRTKYNLSQRRDLSGMERPVGEDGKFKQKDLQGDSLSVLQYCGLATRRGSSIELKDLTEYPRWAELDSAFWQRILIAVLMAVFVQWGTVGAALTISYLTEVKGLGCRSGSYVVYGAMGTVSFMLMFASSFFSHAAMIQHQALHVASRDVAIEEETPASFPLSLTLYRMCAVLTRISGRILVVCNTIWIILTSFWELIGFFNNCWCDGVSLSRGAKGYIILFKTAAEMAPAAVPAWAGGVFLSIFVVASSSAVFWLFCRGNRK
ncbi:hypothetical protein JX265_010895 [Neoarthrinium moseri]|uniref:Transmembrane protein n=1 Tax=Neoarthrinium moseri TaxID=1658444 RepID=A0A9Q0ALD5_9PEZI|nr:uncharacterized protein JN550_008994 [Neoarthrinium moseri]KAI1846308.1 hypothetical protein JX266_007513 [Neoarthrinium moseri]KAI1858227.1 hypothetical protein JX265_010895 [Neoarthrinium moseri]KAI1864437.1 hypothetical protein JN550_008994 [Neoarthrinium moseri]